jgi:serine/threonine protein kinase
MATVYVAQDTKHGRLVALKVLNAGLTMSLGAERFRREIAVAASLHHPHILTVLDSGATPEGQLWFTMPYVEGENLRARLTREGALPILDAIRIARQPTPSSTRTAVASSIATSSRRTSCWAAATPSWPTSGSRGCWLMTTGTRPAMP